jgi:hypothetical protein
LVFFQYLSQRTPSPNLRNQNFLNEIKVPKNFWEIRVGPRSGKCHVPEFLIGGLSYNDSIREEGGREELPEKKDSKKKS